MFFTVIFIATNFCKFFFLYIAGCLPFTVSNMFCYTQTFAPKKKSIKIQKSNPNQKTVGCLGCKFLVI